jgi:thymidylate synthase
MNVNTEYRRALKKVLFEGQEIGQTMQGVPCLRYPVPEPMRFRLSEGAPLITERKISFWRAAIGEIFAFINGAHTQSELEAFGCPWWDKWVTKEKCSDFGLPEGDLGPGSYGAAFHDFPISDREGFNQWEALVENIKEKPWARTHFISPWVPWLTIGKPRKVVVAPCHGWVQIMINDDMEMDLVMYQRSADLPIGVPSNLIQYSALLLALAQVCGCKVGTFIHVLADAHIYCNQKDAVIEMLDRDPRPLPFLDITEEGKKLTSLFGFRKEHFQIRDYNPHPAITDIPVGI